MNSQRVLAFLALQTRPLLRSHVAGQLWTDATEDRASANLRSALWRLNRAYRPLVEVTSTHLRLARDIRVDLHETAELARAVIEGDVDSSTLDFSELPLEGDLLPDWYDDWIVVERERFRQLRLHALECLCERLRQARLFAEAVEAGLAAVASEPLRESAHRCLIAAYLAEGNRGEAIRQYHLYRDLLRDELGVEPSPQMEDLVSGLTVSSLPGSHIVIEADAWT
jgi:DNA-binding SARP family transcriptional activator